MQCNGPGRGYATRPIIPSNGNPTGKLRVRVSGPVGSGSTFRDGLGTGTGKHHRVRVRVG